MKDPRLGMHFEDVRRRVSRIAAYQNADPTAKSNLINSLLGQTERNDGIKARREIEKELNSK